MVAWLLQEERATLAGCILVHTLQGSHSPQEFLQTLGTATSTILYLLPSSQTNLSNAEQPLPPVSHSLSRCRPPVALPGGSGEWNQLDPWISLTSLLSLILKPQVSEIPSLTKARWTGPKEPKVVLILPKGERQTHRHRWTDREIERQT